MPDMINTLLAKERCFERRFVTLWCPDGYMYQIGASPHHACFPQALFGPYEEVEVFDEEHGHRSYVCVDDLCREIAKTHAFRRTRT